MISLRHIVYLVAFVLLIIIAMEMAACRGAGAKPVIHRLDPLLDELIGKDTPVEKIADGLTWVEGPVWDRQNQALLFSDIPNNRIMRWKSGEGLSEWMKPSGYTGTETFTGREPGSNGLTFDRENRLIICQHGNRQIVRRDQKGQLIVLADSLDGRRLNSPNDAVFRSNGDLFFTDPPFGLPGAFDDPHKELDFCGVYRLTPDGRLFLLVRDITAPNGIAFSPDEKKLYLSDPKKLTWLVYDMINDSTAANGRVFADASQFKDKPGGPDGIKVDDRGNVFTAGPGGIYIFSSEGKLLGRIDFGAPTGNCNWGEDGQTLFITSNTAVYRVRLKTKGSGF